MRYWERRLRILKWTDLEMSGLRPRREFASRMRGFSLTSNFVRWDLHRVPFGLNYVFSFFSFGFMAAL